MGRCSGCGAKINSTIGACEDCIRVCGGEPKNHDSHYSKQAIEPQSVIEQVARNIHDKVTPEQAINILQSLKYMLRLGTKDDVLKEVSKSVNYQTRALTGEWRK